MCDYMCGREATIHIGTTNICSVCNAANKKVPFNEEVNFFEAWAAYEANYPIFSIVTGFVKNKKSSLTPASFRPDEIRGKWKVLKN